MTEQTERTHRDLAKKTGWPLHPIQPQDKRPLLIDWPNKASWRPQDIDAWEQTYPNCNWGIVTGSRSKLLVLDIDPRHDGDKNLTSLIARHGALPETVQVRTGGGGDHYYFKLPAEEIRWPKDLLRGVEFKADGGQVIAPGSIHPDGGIYEWVDGRSPWDLDPADAPEWLVELAKTKSGGLVTPAMGKIPEGQRDERLFAESRRLASMGWSEEAIYQALVARNRNCDPPLHDQDVRRIAAQGPKYAKSPEQDLGTTDADNARRLVHRHGASIRFVRSDRGGSWYVYNGRWWESGPLAETLVMQKAEETARSIATEGALEPDQKRAKALLEHAARSLNRGRFVSMVDQTKHQPEIAALPGDFDRDDLLINLDNGTYDLLRHELRAHDPQDLISRTVGYAFDPGARCPRWEQALEEIFAGDQELISWLQGFFGLALTGHVDHQFVVFMVGKGSNGKSVVLETITKVLGDYAAKCNNALFRTTRNDNEKGYILGGLRNIRFSYASELNEGEQLAAATLKEITGGETLSAREMYAGYTTMVPKFKLAMATNNLPRIDEITDGIWRRIRVVPFDVQFRPRAEAGPGDRVRDDGLSSYLVHHELPGIFNWCVDGLKALQSNDMQMPRCAAIQSATRAYRADEDLLAEWIDDECVEEDGKDSPAELLANFRQYSGYKNFGSKKFKSLMEARGFRSSKSNGRRVYRGIRLQDRTFGLTLN